MFMLVQNILIQLNNLKKLSSDMQIINAIGRRKTSIARVYVKPGKGDIKVNNRDLKEYFLSEIHQTLVKQGLAAVKAEGAYDVTVNVEGGGIKGQAEAVRLGIARALVEFNAENKPALRKEGLMTRDSRMVERKKPGRRKARRRFQFSKR
jgi:small subunit ribosomal protein S9